MRQNDQNTQRKLAKLYVERQIADWMNVLESLDDLDSLEKTVKMQEQEIQQLKNTIQGLDENIVDISTNPSIISENVGKSSNFKISLPVRSAPKVFDSFDDLEVAFDRLEEKM